MTKTVNHINTSKVYCRQCRRLSAIEYWLFILPERIVGRTEDGVRGSEGGVGWACDGVAWAEDGIGRWFDGFGGADGGIGLVDDAIKRADEAILVDVVVVASPGGKNNEGEHKEKNLLNSENPCVNVINGY